MTTPSQQAGYTTIMSRTDAAAELPIQLADELVNGTIRESTALKLGHRVPTTVRDSRVPVLTQRPNAYWINPADTGFGQTTKPVWANQVLLAEELMCIAPIPNAIIEDSQFPLWESVKPLLVQAMATSVDDAVLWGVNAPATFPQAVGPATVAAGNTVDGDVFAPATDNAGLLLQAAQRPAQQGFRVNGAAVAPGWEFRVGAQRTAALTANPVGQQGPFGEYPLVLSGLPISTEPLRWAAGGALSIDTMVGAWDHLLIGIRRDIRLEVFNEGIISDPATGLVTENLMQQDMSACRLTMRIGFLVTIPPGDSNYTGTRYPFAVTRATTAGPVGLASDVSAESKGAHSAGSGGKR